MGVASWGRRHDERKNHFNGKRGPDASLPQKSVVRTPAPVAQFSSDNRSKEVLLLIFLTFKAIVEKEQRWFIAVSA